MKHYSILFSSKALKPLSKLDRSVVEMIKKWIVKNLDGTDEPRQYGKALTGDLGKYWRYRIGDYRIIAEIIDADLVLVAIAIDHRKNVYN